MIEQSRANWQLALRRAREMFGLLEKKNRMQKRPVYAGLFLIKIESMNHILSFFDKQMYKKDQ